MIKNTKPLSVAVADDENNIKFTKTRLLHSRGNPILSWIKNSCNKNDDSIPKLKPNVILSTDKTNNTKSTNSYEYKESNSSQPELSGVQNLRHLWNARITKAAKALSPAKSYGCLLQREKPPPDIARALSVHNIIENLEHPTSVRTSKDNFYKYKTAATVEKNRCQSTSPGVTPTHGLSSRCLSLNNCHKTQSTNSGENNQKMRRDDILIPKNTKSPPFQQEIDENTKINTMIAPHLEWDTPAKPQVISLQPVIDSDNEREDTHSIGETREATESDSSWDPLRSFETKTSASTKPVTTTTPRRKNVSTTRKYSFKTQAKSYHSPRKMPNHNASSTSNKVAKLTQQFNEIIQKDKKILDEVKRNNGILISRGGHVYKVIDNSDTMTIEPSVLPSRDKEIISSPMKNISSVQRAIETFESKTSGKPKLPLKSAQVLRKKTELTTRSGVENELKPFILRKTRENANIAGEHKSHPVANCLDNNFSFNVSNAIDLLEGNNNTSKTKTEHILKTSDSLPSCHVQDCEKLSFRQTLSKTVNNKEDNVNYSKVQAKSSEYSKEEFSKISENAAVNESLQKSTENDNIAEKTSNTVSRTQLSTAEVIAEEKILNALEEVNDKIELLCLKQGVDAVEPICNSTFNQANVNKDNEGHAIINEAINTSLVDKIQCILDDEKTAEVPKEAYTEQTEFENQINNNVDSIYEFIDTETKNISVVNSSPSIIQPQKSFLFSKLSVQNDGRKQNVEPCENYESINGYEVCEKETVPPPPRPRKGSTESQRNTTDKLPELPNPKRIIPKKLFTTVLTPNDISSSRTSETGSTNDDDSIYDTIKCSQHSYELLNSSRDREYKNTDTISLASNGYESINHYRRRSMLGNTDSSSTISSEHKTNSLYEVSMVNGILTGGSVGGHNYSHSYIASSENSDDWVDISDSEVNTYDLGKQQFIVVKERTKAHRSPDWSKRVRDKRLNQAISDDDDVDHFYEPLFPVGTPSVQKTNCNTTSPVVARSELSDDYDSFETDDDIYEDNHSTKKDDSGVDICNVKLPDPPQNKRQIYNIMKKFKNLITKKFPNDPNKNLADSAPLKIYENIQGQSEGNEYQTTLKPTRRAPDKPNIIQDNNSMNDNIYENTDFQNFNLLTSQSNLENGLKQSTSERSLNTTNEMVNRSKSNSGKSFKSKWKNLGATSFDSKQTSTMTVARSIFYVSETSSEQDSGIFEKTTPAELNSEKPQIEHSEQKPLVVIRKNKNKASTSNPYRRQTSIGLRPNDPPPPPPISENKTSKQRPSTTSWYTECGVFKIQNGLSVDDANYEKQPNNLTKSTLNTSWYAEAGLYQTSGVSVASSSGSSGVSMGNEGAAREENGHHMFLNEPLYQIYSAEKLESISRDIEDHETDGYEEIGLNGRNSKIEKPKRTRPTALQLVGPRSGPSRTLWSEIPEVVSSEILCTLSPRERSLQEAKFEIITSEASYLKSLNLLRSHFMNHHTFHDSTILSSRDRKALFSYITPVHECSERLLSELEACWQDNIMLLGLSKSIYTCAEKHFQVYVAYCEHQGRMDRSLRKLKESKGIFCQKLEELESDPLCCGLTLHSFLMLPMQRVTRLPLLIDAVFSKVQTDDDEYENWKLTLAILNKIVAQCNEAANRCEQAYEIERISKHLEFPSHIRALAIAPAGVAATGAKPRFLVKKGELVHLIWRGDDAKLTFGKKFTKSNIYAFLFSDLMVLTKRKGEEQFTVFDYCPRNMLTISSGDSIPQLPTKDTNQTGKNLILMTLLENNERKTIELILSCPSVSEMERWLQATRPPKADQPGEKLYEQWDCPQVTATHEFVATEPDLLSLEVGDVVNVSRKLPDGWFYGERIRDGVTGWFPGSFTEEVNSAHVRARNLKQRYRLLTFTATYLDMQKRK